MPTHTYTHTNTHIEPYTYNIPTHGCIKSDPALVAISLQYANKNWPRRWKCMGESLAIYIYTHTNRRGNVHIQPQLSMYHCILLLFQSQAGQSGPQFDTHHLTIPLTPLQQGEHLHVDRY